MQKYFITALLIAMFGATLQAQIPKLPFQNMYHDNSGGDFVVLEDEVYHGTTTGIMVFDTNGQFKSLYDTSNFLPGMEVVIMYLDSKNNIWASIKDHGVVKFKDNKFEYFDTTNGLSDNFVRGIVEAPDGSMWFGTNKHGISVWNGSEWSYFVDDDFEINMNQTWELQVDAMGNIWVDVHMGGFYVYDGTNWTFHNKNEKYTLIPENNVTSFYAASDSSVWACFSDNSYDSVGVYKNGVWTYLKDSLMGFRINDFMEDDDGNIYLLGSNEALIFNGSEFTSFDYKELIYVKKAFNDKDGFTWYFANSALVKTMDEKIMNYYMYGYPGALSDVEVSLEKGKVYVASLTKGLGIYDGFQWKNLHQYNSEINETIRDLAVDRSGKIWAGTDNGIFIIDDDTIVSVIPSEDYNNKELSHIFIDNKDTIISTNSAVYKYDNGELKSLSIYNVNKFIRGGNDTLYYSQKKKVSSYYNGVSEELDPENDTAFSSHDLDIVWADDGSIWANTMFGGASKYSNGKWEHFYDNNSPLSNNTVRGMDVDPYGKAWLSTNDKIYMVSPDMSWDSLSFDSVGIRVGSSVKGMKLNENIAIIYGIEGIHLSLYKDYEPEMIIEDFTMSEELPVGKYIAPVLFDSSLFTQYSITMSGTHADSFYIFNNALHMGRPIDFETFGQDTLHLHFSAETKTGTLEKEIVVTIVDINENVSALVLSGSNDHTLYYPFSTSPLLIEDYDATDADGDIDTLSFELVEGNKDVFLIEPETGKLFLLDSTVAAVGNYVLKITVTDGVNQDSITVDVSINNTFVDVDVAFEAELKIYPVPASNVLHIKNAFGYSSASIINTEGKTIKTWTIEKKNFSVDVGNLPKGVYVLEFRSREITKTRRIILN